MNGKPSVFIGSSSEGLQVARAIQYQLRDCALPTVWNEQVFAPTRGYLESLNAALDSFDFAVLVFTADDLERQRGVEALVPRDNVLFELGLFLGRLGQERTFVVCSPEVTRVASDLHGITLLPLPCENWPAGQLVSAVGAPCFAVRTAIERFLQAEKSNPIHALLGQWRYESEAEDLHVWGEAHLELVGEVLKIHGARLRTLELNEEREELQEKRFVWSSKWAAVFYDRKFRFVWEAYDGKKRMEGYCSLNLIGEPADRMEGNFYMLPPDSKAGQIRFSRPAASTSDERQVHSDLATPDEDDSSVMKMVEHCV